MSLLPAWMRRRSDLYSVPADVIVYRDGPYAVAVDGKTKQVIARSTDHGDVIQTAIDHVANNGGGKIYINSGNYTISSTISADLKGGSIIIDGDAEIYAQNIHVFELYNADMVIVRGIRFKTCRVAMRFGEYGVVNKIILENIIVDEFDQYGIMFVKNIDKIAMLNCKVWSTNKPSAEAVLFSHDPRVSVGQYINDVVIMGCEFGAYNTSNIEIYGRGVDKFILLFSKFVNGAKIGHIGAKFALIANNVFDGIIGGMVIDGRITIDDTQSPPVVTREHIAHIIVNNIINSAPSFVNIRATSKTEFPEGSGTTYDVQNPMNVVLVTNNVAENLSLAFRATGAFVSSDNGEYNTSLDVGRPWVNKIIIKDNIIRCSSWNQAIGFRMGTYNIIEIVNNVVENGAIVLDSAFDSITVPTTSISELHIRDNRFIPKDYAIKMFTVSISTLYTNKNIGYNEYIDGATITYRKGQQENITINSGTASFTGDGTTTQFTISHGLVSAPSVVVVTPKGSTPKPDSIDWDGTYIYINYSTAPASGTTLTFSWYARV